MVEKSKNTLAGYDPWSSKNSAATRAAHSFARLFITGYPNITAMQLKKARDAMDIRVEGWDAHVYKSEFVKMYIHLRRLTGNPVMNNKGIAIADVMGIDVDPRDKVKE